MTNVEILLIILAGVGAVISMVGATWTMRKRLKLDNESDK